MQEKSSQLAGLKIIILFQGNAEVYISLRRSRCLVESLILQVSTKSVCLVA